MNTEERKKFFKEYDDLRDKYEKKFGKEIDTFAFGNDFKRIYDLMKKSLDEGKDCVPDVPDDVLT